MSIFSSAIQCMSGEYINLDSPDIIKLDVTSASKGNQVKYYDSVNKRYIKRQFEYQGKLWKDYMVEHLSSVIGIQLNTNIKIIRQDIVRLSDGSFGVISDDFAIGYDWVSAFKFSDCSTLVGNIGKSYKVFSDIVNMFNSTGLSKDILSEYLIVMIILDFLLGNEDRHYNNFGVLKNTTTSEYKVAPLFDFGIGLFEHDMKYSNLNLCDAKKMMDGKPFDRNLLKPFDMIVNVFGVDKIQKICKDISIPDRLLFPSELAYSYFLESYDYMKERLNI